MFRTSCVHHHEDHLYMQFIYICSSCIYVSSTAAGRMCLIRIETLLWKVRISLVRLHNYRYFVYKRFTFYMNICPSLLTNVYINRSFSYWGVIPVLSVNASPWWITVYVSLYAYRNGTSHVGILLLVMLHMSVEIQISKEASFTVTPSFILISN